MNEALKRIKALGYDVNIVYGPSNTVKLYILKDGIRILKDNAVFSKRPNISYKKYKNLSLYERLETAKEYTILDEALKECLKVINDHQD